MIPVCEPWLTDLERDLVSACLRAGHVSSTGPYVEEFERAWSAECDRKHGVAVSSGTAGLELAVRAAGIAPGDEVIVPTFTIISCVLAVIRAGGVPVLVDADPDTWGMRADLIEARVTSRTRAIMPVHIYGHPVDMNLVLPLAERHRLVVIEDAAEAHGAECRVETGSRSPWRRCGGFGDASVFSFYANKPVTTGEGGMVLTNDDALAARLRSLRNLAFGAERRFEHTALGTNARLTNLQAALGVAQVRRLDEILRAKRRVAARYAGRLADVDGVSLQTTREWARPIWWMNGIVIDGRSTAEMVRRHLADREIDTRPFFTGMHEQPALRAMGLFEGEAYPVAERLARQGLYLPSSPTLTDDTIDRVCDAVRSAVA